MYFGEMNNIILRKVESNSIYSDLTDQADASLYTTSSAVAWI